MATKVGEFFINLAVDAASGNLSVNQLVGALGQLDVASVGTVGVLSKITDTLWGMAKAATGTAVELTTLNDITGVDPKMAQQWERAAERINISGSTIVRSIKAVHEMNRGIAGGTSGPPAALTGILGINPYNGTDANGHPIMKEFFQVMAELRQPGSRYNALSENVKQSALANALPGADADALYRILKDPNFHPEKMPGLDNAKMKELTDVQRAETKVGQELTGIFEKLLIGGGAFAEVLESLSEKLNAIDAWLGSKQGNQVLGVAGKFGGELISHYGDPYQALWGMSKNSREHLAGKLGFGPASVPRIPSDPLANLEKLNATLTINMNKDGKFLGTKKTFVGSGVTNADTWDLTDQVGNGGQGQ